MRFVNSIKNRITEFDPRHAARTAQRFLATLVKGFMEHGCQKNAAALTYMTLFALVPLMTVMYSVFSMIPAFDGLAERLQEQAFDHLVPTSGAEVQTYLADFASQARSLTGVGVAILVVTAYLMLTNIEKTFNAIWGVDKARRGLSSFLLYWAVLSIGPILLGVGMAVSTYLISLRFLMDEYHTLGLLPLFFRLLPIGLTTLAFTLLFAAVPNCRVPMRYALIGGLVTAVLFELMKDLFSWAVAQSAIDVVYGAFATVPLFLLWINLLWTIILGGAILVRTLAEQHYVIREGKVSNMVAALKVLALFHEHAKSGLSVSDRDCYRRGLGVVSWQRLRSIMVRNHWISPTSTGHYVLCRDLRTVTVWDLGELVGLNLSDLSAQIANPLETSWYKAYVARKKQVVDSLHEGFDISVEALLTGESDGQPIDALGPEKKAATRMN